MGYAKCLPAATRSLRSNLAVVATLSGWFCIRTAAIRLPSAPSRWRAKQNGGGTQQPHFLPFVRMPNPALDE